MSEWRGLENLTGLGLAGLALLVLALTIRVIVLRKAPDNALVALETKISELEGRIERKDQDVADDFGRCWAEINKLREFRHDHASTLTSLNFMHERMRALEQRHNGDKG